MYFDGDPRSWLPMVFEAMAYLHCRKARSSGKFGGIEPAEMHRYGFGAQARCTKAGTVEHSKSITSLVDPQQNPGRFSKV